MGPCSGTTGINLLGCGISTHLTATTLTTYLKTNRGRYFATVHGCNRGLRPTVSSLETEF